jgi:hypothetical protein
MATIINGQKLNKKDQDKLGKKYFSKSRKMMFSF